MSGFENIRDAALRAAAACLAIGFASVQSASAQEDAKTTAQNYADCPQEFSADAAIPACWCDPNPTGRIWGTDIYTNDSNICVAAAHAGVISADEGGVISVIPQPGQSSYSALIRNGVHSDSYGSWDASFSVSPVENVELAQQASGAAAEEKRSNQASLTEVQPETPSELTEACNAVDDQYKELYEKLFSSLSVSDLTRLSELHNTFWGATAWIVQYNDLCEQNPEVLAKQQEELQALIAWGNGDETLSEIDPELVAKCDGLDAEYEREWNASKTTISGLGDNGAVRMFLFKFREPDEWSAEWDGRCEQGSDYLEEQTWGLDELVAWRTDKVNDAQERRMLAARNEREAIQRQQAREQENARREAEQQRLARQVREQAPLHFSEGTILWQLVFGEYNAADELAIEWARTEFAEPMSKAAEFFAPGSGMPVHRTIVR